MPHIRPGQARNAARTHLPSKMFFRNGDGSGVGGICWRVCVACGEVACLGEEDVGEVGEAGSSVAFDGHAVSFPLRAGGRVLEAGSTALCVVFVGVEWCCVNE